MVIPTAFANWTKSLSKNEITAYFTQQIRGNILKFFVTTKIWKTKTDKSSAHLAFKKIKKIRIQQKLNKKLQKITMSVLLNAKFVAQIYSIGIY